MNERERWCLRHGKRMVPMERRGVGVIRPQPLIYRCQACAAAARVRFEAAKAAGAYNKVRHRQRHQVAAPLVVMPE